MTTQSNPIIETGLAPGCVFGADPAMQPINAMVSDIARTDIPVLLLGESGTGKEVYARLLHKMSLSPEASFKKIQCAAAEGNRFKEELVAAMQAERDGHRDAGRTVFLDEIDELDQHCQRTLLSALMHAENTEEDSENPLRLICAASRDLEEEVARGRFRRELFFRINGVCLRLPPLRERKEDIPVLLDYFLTKQAAQLHKPVPALGEDVLCLLQGYHWPGNIRELENLAKKIVAFGQAKTALSDLRIEPQKMLRATEVLPNRSLRNASRAASRRTEQELILKALERTRWNRKRAAQELQISYKALLYKLKQIRLPGGDTPED
jgi:two-component system response regulator AtoC